MSMVRTHIAVMVRFMFSVQNNLLTDGWINTLHCKDLKCVCIGFLCVTLPIKPFFFTEMFKSSFQWQVFSVFCFTYFHFWLTYGSGFQETEPNIGGGIVQAWGCVVLGLLDRDVQESKSCLLSVNTLK